jgi:hypothetical protein
MKIVRIKNLVDSAGQCDYKGLDIGQFVAGMQVYRLFGEAKECAIITRQEEIPVHEDVTVINETEYDAFIQLVAGEAPPTPEDIIAALQAENAQIRADLESTNHALDYIVMNMPVS